MKHFKSLTKHLPLLKTSEEELKSFIDDLYSFIDVHPEYELNSYIEILKRNNIEWGFESMKNADISQIDEVTVLALLVGAVRAEHFCEGALISFLDGGHINKWLTRLSELDEE